MTLGAIQAVMQGARWLLMQINGLEFGVETLGYIGQALGFIAAAFGHDAIVEGQR